MSTLDQVLPDESSDDVEWSMHEAASRINASFWARNGFGEQADGRAAARAVIRQELAHMRRLQARYAAARRREAYDHQNAIGGKKADSNHESRPSQAV